MFCVSLFSNENEITLQNLSSLLTNVVKKTFMSEKYNSHILLSNLYISHSILSICVFSLSRLSQVNAKIREICARRTCHSLCQRYSNTRRLFSYFS